MRFYANFTIINVRVGSTVQIFRGTTGTGSDIPEM